MEFSSLKNSNTNEIYEVRFPFYCSRLLTDFGCGRIVYRSPGKLPEFHICATLIHTSNRALASNFRMYEPRVNGHKLPDFFSSQTGNLWFDSRPLSPTQSSPSCHSSNCPVAIGRCYLSSSSVANFTSSFAPIWIESPKLTCSSKYGQSAEPFGLNLLTILAESSHALRSWLLVQINSLSSRKIQSLRLARYGYLNPSDIM